MKKVSILTFLFLLQFVVSARAVSGQIEKFKIGKDEFKIQVSKKKISSADGKTVLIEYSVYKNGKFLQPEKSVIGGRLLGCEISSTGPALAPVLRETSQIGWFVRTGGICGNTDSSRLQLVVVGTKARTYAVREFLAKDAPVVLKAGDETEIWHTEQEWGQGGTATSFYVPHRLLVRPADSGDDLIHQEPLPADFSKWPKLQDVSLFPSYFVAGLQGNNAPLMREAVEKAFKESESEIYQAEGLPGAKAELLRLADAVATLAPVANLFGER